MNCCAHFCDDLSYELSSAQAKNSSKCSITYEIFEIERSDWSCPNSGSIKFLYSTSPLLFLGLGAAQLRCHERNYCASLDGGGGLIEFSVEHSYNMVQLIGN